MGNQQVGVIGLAVMGKNLALNIADHGYSVSVYNRSSDKTRSLIEESEGKNMVGTYSVEEFVQSLEQPRKIILMVKAGEAVDATIEQLTPFPVPLFPAVSKITSTRYFPVSASTFVKIFEVMSIR